MVNLYDVQSLPHLFSIVGLVHVNLYLLLCIGVKLLQVGVEPFKGILHIPVVYYNIIVCFLCIFFLQVTHLNHVFHL